MKSTPINRAIKHITRKKSKSIMLFLTLLVLSTFIITCLALRNSSDAAAVNVRNSLGGSILINAKQTDGDLTDDVIHQILNIDGVRTEYEASLEFYAEYLDADGQYLDIISYEDNVIEGFEHAGRVVGTRNSDNNNVFTENEFKLISGSHITSNDQGKALIHSSFAEKNNLKIGDNMYLSLNDNIYAETDSSLPNVKLEIAGIFTDYTPEEDREIGFSNILYENTIFTDTDSLNTLLFPGRTPSYFYATFQIADPEDITDIIDRVQQINHIDWDQCVITPFDQEYQKTKESLNAITRLANIFLVVILCVSVILLSLILTFWIRERTHETGIMISMGIGWGEIMLQHLAEVLLISAVAFTLSYGSSRLISNVASDIIIQQTLTKTESESDEPESTDETLSIIDAKVTAKELLLVYLLGTIIISLSVGISLYPVFKIKPKNLLSVMN